ncbi:MAG TPA: hypothetical protein VL551_25045 [Actinospica sp.]|jgi:hypothetical protein|nr:hypothetical protein [Actinospica sp.]
MSEREDEQGSRATTKPRLNLTTSQVAASALAACCASVVASYLGVAGTVIGAAVGSVVATTGAAIWGHLFHRGGEKIKQTLLINGELVEVEEEAPESRRVPAGRFYGANRADLWTPKDATAETRLIVEPEPAAEDEAEEKPSRVARILKYRKPMGIAAAIVAVFSVSIVVGMLVGAPVRNVGSSTTPSTTTTTTVTETTHGAGDGASESAQSSASNGSGATASSSASSSSSGTSSTSPSASPSASASASSAATASSSPQGQGATATGSP